MAACFQAIGTQGVRYAVAPREAPGSLASADTADRNVFAGVCCERMRKEYTKSKN